MTIKNNLKISKLSLELASVMSLTLNSMSSKVILRLTIGAMLYQLVNCYSKVRF
jgi:hypothetical protein